MARSLRRAAWVLCLAALALGGAVQAADPLAVTLPSLDAPGGRALELAGFWFAAPGAQTLPAPAMLILHGCGGLYNSRGQLAARYTELAARLNALGIHVLASDSLGPRGEKEICTQRTGQRRITQTQRRRDALGAMQWLAAQPGVDGKRIGLLGWSNGGSTVLAAINQRHREVGAAAVKPTLAVAFYPGCESELERGFDLAVPLLMLLGEADDWTPAEPCKALAAAANPLGGARPQWQAFDGAYHGFDGTEPVRLRSDVPNGVNPGHGVHVGGNPAARDAAASRLRSFLIDTWSLKP